MNRTSKFYVGGLTMIAAVCLTAATIMAILYPPPSALYLVVVVLLVWAAIACMCIIDFIGRV